MKAVISSNWEDLYLFNIPIVAWAWKQLGVDVIWFQTSPNDVHFSSMEEQEKAIKKLDLISYTQLMQKVDMARHFIECPSEKAATYAQVSRLFACCLNLPEDEIMITSDADMLVFKIPPIHNTGILTIFGNDLTPINQYPMCYASGTVKEWRDAFRTKLYTSYQQQLDYYLGNENCQNMRGNLWSRDQELLYNYTIQVPHDLVPRARPGTQFASNRLDRDDSFILDRLSLDIVDYHMHRPLWKKKNFETLLTILRYFWPNEDFQWVINYRDAYVKLM